MKTILLALIMMILPAGDGGSTAIGADPAFVGTYSIVARDPVTGDLGIAVQSRFLAVGSVVPWAKANTGAVATQAQANTTFGPEGLRMLAFGWTAVGWIRNHTRYRSPACA